jgi:hypothetical protein
MKGQVLSGNLNVVHLSKLKPQSQPSLSKDVIALLCSTLENLLRTRVRIHRTSLRTIFS